MSERKNLITVSCGACGGPNLPEATRCDYCGSFFAKAEEQKQEQQPKINLSASQKLEIQNYLNGVEQVESTDIYKFFSLLMSSFDDDTLTLMLMPIIKAGATWHVSNTANTTNRTTRDFQLARTFISKGIEKEVIRKLFDKVVIAD